MYLCVRLFKPLPLNCFPTLARAYTHSSSSSSISSRSSTLDLSAAFDTLDREIITNRLCDIGIDGISLYWLISFFKYRTFAVKTGYSISITKLISTGLP